ncbi:MAG: flippase [Dehalococcoidia bacterium]
MSESESTPTPVTAAAELPDGAQTGGARPGVGFLANVNLVFLTYVANAALAFGVAVLVARALGPEGRGVYALFLLSASIAQAVLSLGMGVAAVYELGKRTATLSRVAANAHQITLLSALVSGVLVLLAWPLLGETLRDHDVPYWIFVFAVPLFVSYGLLTTLLQGVSRFVAMNTVIIVQPLVLLALLATGVAAGDVDTTDALVFWSIATLVAIALAIVLLGRPALRLSELLRIDWPSLRRQLSFGLRGQVGNLMQLLNYRLDQFVVLLFVSTAGVGIYAVAVTISQTIWFIPNAVAAVLLPRLTATDESDAARTTPLVCRNTLLVSAIVALGVGVVSPWFVEAFFGGEFSGALEPLLWLLPGAVALSGSKILTSYILSQGRPLTNSMITVASLVVTIVADFALIPPFGITGAAIASTLAYAAHFALSLAAYRQLSGGSVWEAVIVRGDDLRRYVEAARQRFAPAQP